jgi:hypothetical protein
VTASEGIVFQFSGICGVVWGCCGQALLSDHKAPIKLLKTSVENCMSYQCHISSCCHIVLMIHQSDRLKKMPTSGKIYLVPSEYMDISVMCWVFETDFFRYSGRTRRIRQPTYL